MKRVIQGGKDSLAKLDRLAQATPRTKVLAGSPDEGFVTYETRSAGFAFPDYATPSAFTAVCGSRDQTSG